MIENVITIIVPFFFKCDCLPVNIDVHLGKTIDKYVLWYNPVNAFSVYTCIDARDYSTFC